MSYAITSPFPSFNDTDGSPLNNGNVYVGSANLNPVTDPIPVFWDEALTQPAAQPVRTINGYFSRNGSPGRLYTGFVTYSIRVTNNKGVQVFSDLNYKDPSSNAGSTYQQVITAISGQTVFNLSRTYIPGTNNLFVYRNGLRLIAGEDYAETGYSQITLTAGADNGDEFVFDIGYNYDTAANIDAQDVTYKLPDSSSVFTNVEAKLAETVSVKDFGAVGDGVTDDRSAFIAANATGQNVYVTKPSVGYVFSSPLTVTIPLEIDPSATWDQITNGGKLTFTNNSPFQSSTPPVPIHRLNGRLFVGGASGDYSGFGYVNPDPGGAWYGNSTLGPNYVARDSTLVTASKTGRIALSGITRSSDNNIDPAWTATIGVASAVLNDRAAGGGFTAGAAWGFIAEVQHEAGANSTIGMEVAAKNKGDLRTDTPYVRQGGVIGTWYAGRGDSSFGGTATNPNNCAIKIIRNNWDDPSITIGGWRKGIVFERTAIDGTDGITGTATAIEMAKGHQVRWRTPTDYPALTIRSDATNDSANLTVAANNGYLSIQGYSGTCAAFFANATPANYFGIYNAAAGSSPFFLAQGSDTNIGIQLVTKGTGAFRFSTQGSSANLELLVGGVNSAPVNFLHAYGTNSGAGNVVVSANGTDSNIDIQLTTKGTGLLRFGTLVANADAPITGYIMIKDASGTQRKLAVIA